ncbi:MAG TPA: GTP pyrophosphokinase family protein [Candidatus Pullichristensenella excrementigallinarum]|uniref:GTP pyrophosphokinase family protein n=1 Tax=Candidatus Pullichristensenella excrementigallinarum TaxID=2840907 RepID=A0A9D1I9Y0_9FIRM|nr:GTP pyrophosphokinase family protein [Candidatus Pullichristensenella excrementigallinarum]
MSDNRLILLDKNPLEQSRQPSNAAFAEEYRNYQQIYNVYMGAIREIRARLETLDMEFQYRHKHNPIHHIQSRVKTLPSIMKKLHDMGQPMTITSAKKHLHDIAGVRVVCCYVDDIYLIAKLLLSQDDISLILEKDYIKQPKPNGYRSLHIVADVPVYLSQGKVFIPVEIQIRTVAMDFWATLEHGIRYKSSDEVPSFIVDELRNCAEVITRTDAKMQEIFKALQLLNDKEDEFHWSGET